MREFKLTAYGADAALNIVDAGCGTGATLYPLAAELRAAHFHSFDFAEKAVAALRAHERFDAARMRAFVWNFADDDLDAERAAALSGSADLALCIFVLSAIEPAKLLDAVLRLKALLKPGGKILIRD